jgi:hypothetical protein
MASRRETGGVDDCGTAEEDSPVTWETPDRAGGIPLRTDPIRKQDLVSLMIQARDWDGQGREPPEAASWIASAGRPS